MDLHAKIDELREAQRQREEEHRRRMALDPAYRDEQERIEASRRAEQEAEKRRAERQRGDEIAKCRRAKGIPEKFWPFDDAHRAGAAAAELPASVARAHHWVTRFLRGPREWVFLFLAGPPGVGKTAEGTWFLDAPLVRSEPVGLDGEERQVVRESGGLFVTASEFAKAGTYARELWEEVSGAPRLVIDDLGVEQLDGKGYALTNLANLLYHRHAHELKTLVTLNITKAAFAEQYATHDGGRLRDRLTESAQFVELSGPSLRRRLVLDEDGA